MEDKDKKLCWKITLEDYMEVEELSIEKKISMEEALHIVMNKKGIKPLWITDTTPEKLIKELEDQGKHAVSIEEFKKKLKRRKLNES